MKIYNKKGFIRGLICLCTCIFGLGTLFLIKFSVKLTILSAIMFLFSITDLTRSFSKTSTLEDILADDDERDKYIVLKTSHMTLQILEGINYALTILFMVIYAVTKNNIFLVAFILTSAYITINLIVYLFTNIYYEKHE